MPELIGAGLFKDPCLMGVFPPPIPDTFVTPINMISSVGTHMGDAWVLPNPAKIESFGYTMSLSPTELSYSVIQFESESTICFSHENELDQYSLPKWAKIPSSLSHDFLTNHLLSDEAILKDTMVSERPWEYYHHQLSILPMVSRVNTISTLS